ncbi:hypothetical protein E3N88_09980 [Mikania micrantha]|uniref:BHLH domain-containing protein n=1 Tax=Mikania micrantha TaxID=192012 RepID=A0A5N6PAI3_9ASTR|nr:hypothetical protein E3N88_09980 [Mikania micrantha]
MALSYCNWPENSAVNALFHPPSPTPEMFSFHEESTFYNAGVNPMFDYCNYSDDHLLTPAGNVFVPTPSLTYQDPCYSLPYPGTLNQEQLFPVEYAMVPELLPEMGGFVALPEMGGGGIEVKTGGNLSAQSMAARVRRRKISEKTSELGKLVPGGHKMNTAEMFQAAFKYIKFLQAQIGVLQLMPSLPEGEEVLRNGEMQALVTCTMMQEKLYITEKCIGPNTLQNLSN